MRHVSLATGRWTQDNGESRRRKTFIYLTITFCVCVGGLGGRVGRHGVWDGVINLHRDQKGLKVTFGDFWIIFLFERLRDTLCFSN